MRNNRPLTLFVAAFTVVFGFLTTPQLFAASKEKVLHSFNRNDGANPYAGLIFDAAGNLYGTSDGGGAFGGGTVFELTSGAGGTWTETVLYNFGAGDGDGGGPEASLTFDAAGNLYGTTVAGGMYCGPSGCGTVFELTPGEGGTWTEKVLHNFNVNDGDGAWPVAGVIFDAAGNLYGTTPSGGALGRGTVFELTPGAGGTWTETVLFNFGAGNPQGGLIFDTAGNLYGTTDVGGTKACPNCGTVFELTKGTNGMWTKKVLHNFGSNGKDGRNPVAGLIFDAAGNLYGTTLQGVGGGGTVFELSPTVGGGWKEKILHSFDGNNDGKEPRAGLILDAAGKLYGTTAMGGAADCRFSDLPCGTVFRLTPGTNGEWTEKVLRSFNGSDGAGPFAGLIFDAAGNLYGTTASGGTGSGCNGGGCGTVFEITPN